MPLVDTWLARDQQSQQSSDDIDLANTLRPLFLWLADPCLAFLAKEGSVLSPVCDSNLIQSWLNILEVKISGLTRAERQSLEAPSNAAFSLP